MSNPASTTCAGTPRSGRELLPADAHVYFDSLCAVNGYKSGRGGGIVEIADRCSLADYERGLAAQRDIVERGDGEARRATRALVWQG
ncbi:hypothetical protein MMC15_004748 [Xylographa vitiligo]|nr:hypothetical protein [Xylographa vitiligo]